MPRNALRLVRVLDNADKHHDIIAMHPGLNNPTTVLKIKGEILLSHAEALRHDGTDIGKFDVSVISPRDWPKLESEVDVQTYGPLHITLEVAREKTYIDAPVELTRCLNYIGDYVIPELLPFVIA